MRFQKLIRAGALAVGTVAVLASSGWAQTSRADAAGAVSQPNITVEQPDAQRTKDELSQLLDHYPPSLRAVLALDPGLLGNQSYLAPYPALSSFLNAHPEIVRNPGFYINRSGIQPTLEDHAAQVVNLWRDLLNGLGVFLGFGMAIGLIVWLIRTLVDYRRWNRLTKVQTEVHSKLLDRFTANDDLLAYIQSPAGAKFLESSPITLDPGPRSVGAPLGRILWSVQAGLVVIAAGIGLQVVSTRVSDDASQPLHALGVLGIALGIGFVISAIISFLISRRLGLIEPANRTALSSAQR
jgi:hypothetical protein